MWAALIATFVFGLISGVLSDSGPKDLPSYLTACKKDAPDFDACCLSSAREGLPHIINGDNKYGIPNFRPLKVERVELKTATLNFLIEDIALWGLDEAEIKDFRVDLKNNKISIDLHSPQIKILGKYKMDGKISIVKLEGNGDANITLEQPDISFSTGFKIIKRDEYDYIQVEDDSEVTYTMQRVNFHFDNLFNGNEQLSKSTNEILNQEWKPIVEDISPAIKTTIKTIAASIINGFTSRIPYQNMLL